MKKTIKKALNQQFDKLCLGATMLPHLTFFLDRRLFSMASLAVFVRQSTHIWRPLCMMLIFLSCPHLNILGFGDMLLRLIITLFIWGLNEAGAINEFATVIPVS
jgi:hypothetical protein